jgi:dTDP-4-amino-4,6-dideoxygalactose transaminase
MGAPPSGIEPSSSEIETAIPLALPSIGASAAERIRAIIEQGWVTQGKVVEEFEQAIAQATGAAHAVAVNSGTDAIHLLLKAVGVGANAEVLVPAFTFVATANAVIHAGAIPQFVDVSAEDANMDLAAAAAAIGPRTRAILLVHQFGFPADLAGFRSLCRKNGLLLIEDAACALGCRLGTESIGGGDSPATFSFHPRKIVTTGEGGAITTCDSALAERLRHLRFHGAQFSTNWKDRVERPVTEEFVEAGFNAKMSDVLAAIGVEQMGRLAEFLEARRRLADRYDEAFATLSELSILRARPESERNGQSYFVVLKDYVRRERLLAGLAAAHILARRAMPSLSRLAFYASHTELRTLPVSERLAECGLFLPLYPTLSIRDQDRVIRVVRNALA